MLSSSRNVLLKLTETTSPPKLFPSYCISLYFHTLQRVIFEILEKSDGVETEDGKYKIFFFKSWFMKRFRDIIYVDFVFFYSEEGIVFGFL